MRRAQIIIILLTVAVVGAFGYFRSDKNEYAEREVALDSVEVKNAEVIFKQLAKSTNHLVHCISPKASPVGQQMLLRGAVTF